MATHTARLEKHTFLHVTIQDFHNTQEHFLVPKDSEQTGHQLKVVPPPSSRRHTRPEDRVSTLLPGAAALTSRYRPWGADAEGDDDDHVRPFDCQMIPVGYSECVSVVGNLPPRREESCVSYCDVQTPTRCRTTLDVAPSFDLVGYTDRVVCFRDCTKRRFKNEVKYQPKLKTTNYAETYILRPKAAVTSFVTFLEYNAYETEQQHVTTMDLAPRTYSLASVHNFQLLTRRRGSVSSEDDTDDIWTTGRTTGYNTMSSEEENFSPEPADDFDSSRHGIREQTVEQTPMGRLPRRWEPDTGTPQYRTRGVVKTGHRDPSAYGDETIIFMDT